MSTFHTNNKIIRKEGGEYFVRGQREYPEDEIKKTKSEILLEFNIDLDALENASLNAQTYTKNRPSTNGEIDFEGNPAGYKALKEAYKTKVANKNKVPEND
jgi:uncharacterized protein (DUF1330 family)